MSLYKSQDQPDRDPALAPVIGSGRPLPILYGDAWYLAVNKPAGMMMHRGAGEKALPPFLLQTLRDQVGERVYPVHRLDQPTSGIVVFARSPAAAAALVELFSQRQVTKHYQALVRGWTYPEGSLPYPLLTPDAVAGNQPLRIDQPRQPALTLYTTIGWYEVPWDIDGRPTSRFAWIEASPRTGRWHQIRRHLKQVAHPIVGDYRHGDERYNLFWNRYLSSDRMMLSAVSLSFQHPVTGAAVEIRAERDPAFSAALAALEPHRTTMSWRDLPPQPASQRMELVG
jgi:tRNA pseudouridine65 synthase